MEVINVDQKFSLFSDHWSPKIIAQLNGQDVKLAKLKGSFVWHSHENEDELFMVIKGKLAIAFRDKTIHLNPGELIVIPKGVEHKPIAEEEVLIMLFEPSAIKHTGNVQHEITVDRFDFI